MTKVFVYSENARIAAELSALGKGLGAQVSVLALDADDAQQKATVGADAVCLLNGADPRPESNARAIAGVLADKAADLFLVGSTARGRELAALVAGYAQCALASDASDIQFADDGVHIKRMTYGGVLVQEEVAGGLLVATVSAGSCEPIEGASAAPVEEVAIVADDRVKVVASAKVEKSGADLAGAKAVIAAGLGIQSEDDLGLVRDVAAQLGGGVGCTRGLAEDRGWFQSDEYIGISGLVLKPDFYLGIALSGAMQHMFGVRDAKVIAAINSSKDAPVFQVADYGIVGDYKEVLPKLLDALKSA